MIFLDIFFNFRESNAKAYFYDKYMYKRVASFLKKSNIFLTIFGLKSILNEKQTFQLKLQRLLFLKKNFF